MLLFSVFLLTWITSHDVVYSVMPAELPFYAEDGNWIIKAKLTDKSSPMQIKIDEYIQSLNGTITGKIVYKVDNYKPTNIYYKSSNPYERLFVLEARCTKISYKNYDWDHFLSEIGIDNFATHLILVGPSVLFRINKLSPVWTPGEDDDIRGVKQHSARAALDPHLNVWFYYRGNNLEDLKRPTRIFFSGYNSKTKSREIEQYWFDFYMITRVDQNFDTIVTPEPGIVCDKYFDETSIKPLPKFNQHVLHTVSKTKSFKAGPDKKEEVYADDRFQILRMHSSSLDNDNKIITDDAIYDYQLGLKYQLSEDEKCSISPMDSSSPGIVKDSALSYGNFKLDLSRLLDLDRAYRYLGPALFEDRDEIGIQAWEKYDAKLKFGNKNFQNVITTQYIRGATDTRTGYTLVGTTFKAHDRNKKLIASLTKSYFHYSHEISPSDSMEKFSVEDCYSDPKAKKTIAFHFTCPGTHCGRYNQYYHQIQDKIAESLINTRTISASRISNIVPIIDSKEIIIYVTILDFPNIKSAFKMQNMKLAQKTLTTASRVVIDGDEEACLRTNSYKYEPFKYIAFCKTEDGNVCQKIDDKKVKLIEDKDNGISCSVFMTPLQNVYRYSRESPLDSIHEKLTSIEITLVSPEDNEAIKLTSYQVKDVTKPVEEYNPIYETIMQNTKVTEDKLNTIRIVGTINLSSCHRKCVQSTEIDCKSFSFCTYPDRIECFLSTISNITSEKISQDPSCGTYFINNLVKFKKISSKKFTDIEEFVPFESSLEKCASFCSHTDACKSFQYCSGSCSLAGYYTDTSSVYSESCNVYIPNVLNRFKLTGKLIVEDVFHTELNLNAEQCAALCHDWKDNDSVCKSFNFCPENGKTSSLCHLSKYSIRDENEKLIHSDSCQNYERNKQRADTQLNTQVITKPQHFATFYWIIGLIVATGFVSGIIVSVIYSKIFTVKSSASEIYNHNTFSWTKQLNDERQSVALSESLQMSSDYAVPASEGL